MPSTAPVTDDELLALLRDLGAPAPSGREHALRAQVAGRWRPHVAELEVDGVGNLVGRVGGEGPSLLLTAHLDEIGYVVRHVTADGFLLLDTSQGGRRAGPEVRHVIGHEARVLGRDGVVAEGFFAAASGHVLRREQVEQQRLDWGDFWVDLGLGSRDEVERAGVHVGAPVIFGTEPARRVGRRLGGKTMDDRLLLAVIELVLERLDPAALPCELWVAATVQEETGLHGARALVARRRFDAAVALDVGLVGDVPTVGREEYDARLGAGPIVVHRDAQASYDHALTWGLLDAAGRAGVPVQHGVFSGYGSDGVALLEGGVPPALLTVPTRYTHSPFELVDPDDVRATVALLLAFLAAPAGLRRPAA